MARSKQDNERSSTVSYSSLCCFTFDFIPFRYVVLDNGLRALLISDYSGPATASEDEDSEGEGEEEEDDQSGDETEDESEEDDDEGSDEDDEDGEMEGKKKKGNSEKQVLQ